MVRHHRSAAWLLLPATAILLAAFAYPVFRLLLQSFTGPGGEWPSLDSYVTLLSDPFIRAIFLRTLAVGMLATVVCLLFGLPLAWGYVRSRGVWRSLILVSVIAPLLINHVVRTYGWTVILGRAGVVEQFLRWAGVDRPPQLIYTEFAVMVGLVSVFTPFMVLALVPAFARIDNQLYAAATSLGASPLRQLMTITLPLVRPGIAVGCVLVFALTQGAFVAPLMLGGSGVQMTTTLVYTDAMVLYNWPRATATAVILLIVVLLIISLQARLARTRWAEQ
jgi:putative spermidine/putrescine transport system permease protein